MTTWAAASGASTLYEGPAVESETVFDGGETRFDVEGGVVRTRFDVVASASSWAAASTASTSWS